MERRNVIRLGIGLILVGLIIVTGALLGVVDGYFWGWIAGASLMGGLGFIITVTTK